MEISSNDAQIGRLSIGNNLEQLGKIAERIDKLRNHDGQKSRTDGSASNPFSNVDKNGIIPSLNKILPNLLRQLAELGDESDTTKVLGNDAVAKNTNDLSPLSFLTKDERTELKTLLTQLYNKNTKSSHGAENENTGDKSITVDASTNREQWALFKAFDKITKIFEKAEDRVHESVEKQLSPLQNVLGNFLAENTQERAIALFAQKSLIEEKGKNNPLSKQDQNQLSTINKEVSQIFAKAEKDLQDGGINVGLLKTSLNKGDEINEGTLKNILGTTTLDRLNDNQGKLADVLLDIDAEKGSGVTVSLADNFVLQNLSRDQKIVLSLISKAQFHEVMKPFERLNELTTKTTLNSAEAKEVYTLSKKTTEALTDARSQQESKGFDTKELAKLLGGNKSFTIDQLSKALGMQNNQDVSAAQSEAVEIVSEHYNNLVTNAGGISVEGSAVASNSATFEQKKIDFPAPLTPMQAIQKRIESARQTRVTEVNTERATETRTELLRAQTEPKQSSHQPSTTATKGEDASALKSVAGIDTEKSGSERFSSTTGRSTVGTSSLF